MDTNFSYLKGKTEYALFGPACIDAENVLSTSPVMSAVASRKAGDCGLPRRLLAFSA